MHDPYHVYLDLDVINNDYENIGYPILLFEETKNNQFLEGDGSEYFCNIVRFYNSDGQDSTCVHSPNPSRAGRCESHHICSFVKL